MAQGISNSGLRITDLMKDSRPAPSRLMNVKVPASIVDAIDKIAGMAHASKTEVVIALLNEGLEAYHTTKASKGKSK